MSQATRFVAKTVKVVTPSSAPRGVAVFGLNSVGGTTRPQPTKVVWLGTLRGPGQPRPQTGPRAEAEAASGPHESRARPQGTRDGRVLPYSN